MICAYLRQMQLFNVTFIADKHIGKELESWLLNTHLPIVKATGLFISERLLRVLNPQNDGITYCLQFIAENEDHILLYKQEFMSAVHQKAQEEFTERLFLIESLMEFVD
ncbi:protein of unknown function [bacterium A37T11]|nr:protein of unknown function [bacterium A37T11]